MSLLFGYPIYELEIKVIPELDTILKQPIEPNKKKDLRENILFWTNYFNNPLFVTENQEIASRNNLPQYLKEDNLDKIRKTIENRKYFATFDISNQLIAATMLRSALTYNYDLTDRTDKNKRCFLNYSSNLQEFSVRNERVYVQLDTYDPSGYINRLQNTDILPLLQTGNFIPYEP